jgi:hypothetical protein
MPCLGSFFVLIVLVSQACELIDDLLPAIEANG